MSKNLKKALFFKRLTPTMQTPSSPGESPQHSTDLPKKTDPPKRRSHRKEGSRSKSRNQLPATNSCSSTEESSSNSEPKNLRTSSGRDRRKEGQTRGSSQKGKSLNSPSHRHGRSSSSKTKPQTSKKIGSDGHEVQQPKSDKHSHKRSSTKAHDGKKRKNQNHRRRSKAGSEQKKQDGNQIQKPLNLNEQDSVPLVPFDEALQAAKNETKVEELHLSELDLEPFDEELQVATKESIVEEFHQSEAPEQLNKSEESSKKTKEKTEAAEVENNIDEEQLHDESAKQKENMVEDDVEKKENIVEELNRSEEGLQAREQLSKSEESKRKSTAQLLDDIEQEFSHDKVAKEGNKADGKKSRSSRRRKKNKKKYPGKKKEKGTKTEAEEIGTTGTEKKTNNDPLDDSQSDLPSTPLSTKSLNDIPMSPDSPEKHDASSMSPPPSTPTIEEAKSTQVVKKEKGTKTEAEEMGTTGTEKKTNNDPFDDSQSNVPGTPVSTKSLDDIPMSPDSQDKHDASSLSLPLSLATREETKSNQVLQSLQAASAKTIDESMEKRPDSKDHRPSQETFTNDFRQQSNEERTQHSTTPRSVGLYPKIPTNKHEPWFLRSQSFEEHTTEADTGVESRIMHMVFFDFEEDTSDVVVVVDSDKERTKKKKSHKSRKKKKRVEQ